MTSEVRRDPKSDPLLTPENSAFIIIDYQPVQVKSNSGDTILNFVPSALVLAFAGRAGGRAPPPAPRSIARRLVDGRF